MSNFGRIAICPYYLSENRKSVSCEDTIRRFATEDSKVRQLQKYCCTEDWEQCPYAEKLNEMYYKIEVSNADIKNEIYLLHRVDALRTELNKVRSMLGKAEKRIENLQKEKETR